MYRLKPLLHLSASAMLVATLLAPCTALAEPALESSEDVAALTAVDATMQVDAVGQADVACALAPEAPHNGIPTMTVFLDESDQAIADARANDPENKYGTYADLCKSPDHSVRGVGNVSIVAPEGYVSEYGAGAPEGTLQLDFIRGRGNTTWDYGEGMPAKRAYKLKLADKQDLFGMGASKEWALMANAYDDTLLKNRFTSWLSTQIGMPYAPQMVPVDVVLVRTKDGQELERKSLGSYCLSELVDVEPSRVAIDKLKKDAVADEDITGGYLFSAYNYRQNTDVPESNVHTVGIANDQFMFKSPEFESEDLTEGRAKQRDYICNYLSKLDDLLMRDDRIDEERHAAIADMMDLRSTADYWWIQAFSTNMDAFNSSSTYFYKQHGGKLCWGPVWDFDVAYTGEVTSFGQISHWVNELRDYDPQFVKLLKERWLDQTDGLAVKLAEFTRPGGVLDAYANEIRASWMENDGLYPDKNNIFRQEEFVSFDETIERLRSWIDRRRAWINEHLGEVGTNPVTLRYVANGKEFKRETADVRYEKPSFPAEKPMSGSDEFVGWCVEGTDEVVERPDVTQDTTFVAKFRPIEPGAGAGVFPDEVFFMNGCGIDVACGGRVAYRASVLLPGGPGYDWSGSHMTFEVRPDGAKGAARTVDVPVERAARGTGDGGRTLLDFELPLSAIEMGQRVVSTFSYERDGRAESVTAEETLDEQAFTRARWGGDGPGVAYARALHDFGRTAWGFFARRGNGSVTAERYSPMRNALTDSFDHAAARAGVAESLRGIEAAKSIRGSKVKKVCMSLRFDSETTAEINIYTKKPVESLSAHATCKGKTFEATKVSDTQWRIRVTGLRAQDLAELIEVAGDCDGTFSMRCSALSYASAILESDAYGDEGNDFMAAVYNYHKAAKELAE